MATLKEAIQYASQNPTSQFAKFLEARVMSGQADIEAQQEGIDLTTIKRTLKAKGTEASSIIAKEKAVTGNQFKEAEKPQTFLGKARNFAAKIVGGGEVARGAGLALAAPSVQRNIDETIDNLTSQQTQIIKELREKRAKGEDTTALTTALKLNRDELEKIADTASDFADTMPNTKQVVGSAARLAGTAVGGTIAKQAMGLTGAGTATTIAGGVARGAGAGAIAGGVEGAIQGTGIAAEADLPTSELISSGALGAVGGALTGGAIGGAIGGIQGGLAARKIRIENFSKQLAQEPMTKKAKIEALTQGRLKDPSLFKKAEIALSNRDLELADAIDDVVSPKATIGENIDAIRLKVNRTNAGVEDYITQNKTPFNMKQLKSKLIDGKSDLEFIFTSDSNAEKTYNAVSNALMKEVKSGDTLGLFKARQSFDKLPAVQKELQRNTLGENTRKEIILQVRKMANEYIASTLPKDNPYRANMLQEHYMLEALSNIAEKSQNIVGKNKLQIITEKYPILKWLVGGTATAAAGGAGIGVGGALIGSSD